MSRPTQLRLFSRRGLWVIMVMAAAAGIQTRLSAQAGKLICPGGFPTDLTVSNCEFTQQMRVQQWVTVSFTDQAILGAVVYGAGAQIIKSPGEWGRTWLGYGDRVGVRNTLDGAGRDLGAVAFVGIVLERHMARVVTHQVPDDVLRRASGHTLGVADANPVTIAEPRPSPLAGRLDDLRSRPVDNRSQDRLVGK